MIALLTAVTLFTACDNDDATYTSVEPLEVKTAALEFDHNGGQNTVNVASTGTLTATTTSNWLTATVSGSTVTLTAAKNESLEGRSATVVLKAGDKQTSVTATQKGKPYGFSENLDFNLNDDKQTVNLYLVHTDPVSFETDYDWIHPTFNEETSQVELTIDENETTWRRSGEVKVSSGSYSDVITITQFDFYRDVLGDYRFMYYNTAINNYSTIGVTLTKDALLMELPFGKFTFPVKLDPDEMAVGVGPSGSMVGEATISKKTYYTFLTFSDYQYNGPNTEYETKYYSICTLEESDGYLVGDFGGIFKWQQYSNDFIANQWNLMAHSENKFEKSTREGLIISFLAPRIFKPLPDANGAKPTAAEAEQSVIRKIHSLRK